MQNDSDAQAIPDAFDLLAEQQGPRPYWVANDWVPTEGYAGSIFEAVDNMSQRELDHLKGRECGPREGCARCNKIRAYYAKLAKAKATLSSRAILFGHGPDRYPGTYGATTQYLDPRFIAGGVIQLNLIEEMLLP